ncbi:Lsr2 family DNA-binding protein [Actinomadura sediminis]|uniref:Histone-like nucleoid-structuring protein Lsr2 n=1 Tax=Actinomadura sediminis TaxID=1038904 RepID=A0ABW3EMM4_9ACTN
MTTQGEITPWERLRRLSEMSRLEQDVHAKQWANDLASRHGAGKMPIYMRAAYRDTIAAVLLSLVDERASTPDHGDLGSEGRSNGAAAGQASDATRYNHNLDDVPPSVIRAWAHQRGISVSDRGRIPMWVIKRYHAEHAAESESSLASKIQEALEQHGELTKTELWDIVGRNKPSSKIDQAVESLPNAQVFKGESTGGRRPVIVRLVNAESGEVAGPAEVTAADRLDADDLDPAVVPQGLADEASHLGQTDASIDDFLRVLRGDSHNG